MMRHIGLILISSLIALASALLGAAPAFAHEVRPALLQISEGEDGRYEVLWKQPTAGEVAIRLVPRISGGLLERKPDSVTTEAAHRLTVWRNLDAGASGLDGRRIEVEGLRQTITDVLVIVTPSDGERIETILRPQDPATVLNLSGGSDHEVPVYLWLGIEHILAGIDHLCFVLALMLLVRSRMMLVKTITAFTLAHSITLALTAMQVVTVDPPLIEALVALSILFVAVEVVHFYRGREGLTVAFPWLIALTFGLLHGFAFAGALAEIGLPQDAVPLSLLLFYLGVEIGQLMFVAAVLALGWLLRRLPRQLPYWTRWLPPYAIGTFAMVCARAAAARKGAFPVQTRLATPRRP